MNNKEKVREAIMRLSMCANRECEICKYKNRPKTDLPSEECKERSIKNVCILADEFLRKDTVEVVRCKDCKYFGRDMGNGKHSCNNFEMPYCTENDYCSHAKRNIKNGGQERMREILFRGRGDKKYNDGSQSFETYTMLYAELERDD